MNLLRRPMPLSWSFFPPASITAGEVTPSRSLAADGRAARAQRAARRAGRMIPPMVECRLHSLPETTSAHSPKLPMENVCFAVHPRKVPKPLKTPPRVLIVEDFEDARELYAEFLRLRG